MVLKWAGMGNCKTVDTPGVTLPEVDDKEVLCNGEDCKKFRQVVGTLRFSTSLHAPPRVSSASSQSPIALGQRDESSVFCSSPRKQVMRQQHSKNWSISSSLQEACVGAMHCNSL